MCTVGFHLHLVIDCNIQKLYSTAGIQNQCLGHASSYKAGNRPCEIPNKHRQNLFYVAGLYHCIIFLSVLLHGLYSFSLNWTDIVRRTAQVTWRRMTFKIQRVDRKIGDALLTAFQSPETHFTNGLCDHNWHNMLQYSLLSLIKVTWRMCPDG